MADDEYRGDSGREGRSYQDRDTFRRRSPGKRFLILWQRQRVSCRVNYIANVCVQPMIDAAIVQGEVVTGLDHRHQISINIVLMAGIEMIIMSVASGIVKNVEEAELHQILIDTYLIRINLQ